MLTNSTVPRRAPAPFTFRIATMALAKPYEEPTAVSVPGADLAPLAGVYANEWKEEVTVRVNGTNVTAAGPDFPETSLFPLSANRFFLKDSMSRVEFTRNEKGEPVSVVVRTHLGVELKFVRTSKSLPAPVARQAIALDPKIFDRYAGEYEICPGFTIKFFRDGAKFMTQATGQAAFELFAESETKFFLKVVDGQVEFKMDASGAVTGMVLTQNGRELPAKKIK